MYLSIKLCKFNSKTMKYVDNKVINKIYKISFSMLNVKKEN